MIHLPVITKSFAYLQATATSLKAILNKYGLTATLATYPTKDPGRISNGTIYIKHLNFNYEYRSMQKLFQRTNIYTNDAQSRFSALILKLLKGKVKDFSFIDNVTGTCRVICGHKYHRITFNKKNLILHEHKKEDFEANKLMSLLANSKNPRCLKVYDAWANGDAFDKQDKDFTNIPEALRPFFRIRRLQAKYKKTKANKINDPLSNKKNINDRWYSKSINALSTSTSQCIYHSLFSYYPSYARGFSTYSSSYNSDNTAITNNNPNVYFDIDQKILRNDSNRLNIQRQQSLYMSHVTLNDSTKHIFATKEFTNSNSKITFVAKTTLYELNFYIKNLALWYASVYLKGFAVVNNWLVVEKLEELGKDNYKVKIAAVTGSSITNKYQIESKIAVIKKDSGQWQIVSIE